MEVYEKDIFGNDPCPTNLCHVMHRNLLGIMTCYAQPDEKCTKSCPGDKQCDGDGKCKSACKSDTPSEKDLGRYSCYDNVPCKFSSLLDTCKPTGPNQKCSKTCPEGMRCASDLLCKPHCIDDVPASCGPLGCKYSELTDCEELYNNICAPGPNQKCSISCSDDAQCDCSGLFGACNCKPLCLAGWQPGDGTGEDNHENRVSSATSRKECIEDVMREYPDANGVTYRSGHCYAEFKQSRVYSNDPYENCWLNSYTPELFGGGWG